MSSTVSAGSIPELDRPVAHRRQRAGERAAVGEPHPVYFELMDAIFRDGPPRAFDGVTCPVLLAWGTRDRIIPSPRYSQRLRNLLPNAEWIELPGLGHVPMSDDPELVARTIVEFVGRVREPAAVPS